MHYKSWKKPNLSILQTKIFRFPIFILKILVSICMNLYKKVWEFVRFLFQVITWTPNTSNSFSDGVNNNFSDGVNKGLSDSCLLVPGVVGVVNLWAASCIWGRAVVPLVETICNWARTWDVPAATPATLPPEVISCTVRGARPRIPPWNNISDCNLIYSKVVLCESQEHGFL